MPFHAVALDLADMGLVPAGAYRNRDFAEKSVEIRGDVSRAMQAASDSLIAETFM